MFNERSSNLLTAKFLRRVVQVACGWLHNAAIVDEPGKGQLGFINKKAQHKRAYKQTDNVIYVSVLYPSVLMNPFTVPSAKSETISPICRKLVCPAILQRELRIYARRITEQFQHWNSTKMRTSTASHLVIFMAVSLHCSTKESNVKINKLNYKQVV